MKYLITTLTIVLLTTFELHAQETLSATGSEATGSGGTVSYSVGQVVYKTNIGTNGNVQQGVQQPYKISIVVGENETSINLEMNVYPNPTTDYLTLKIEDIGNLTYQLSDMQGRIIESKEVNTNDTNITMEELPSAIYLLKVSDSKSKTVKTFKIIKK